MNTRKRDGPMMAEDVAMMKREESKWMKLQAAAEPMVRKKT